MRKGVLCFFAARPVARRGSCDEPPTKLKLGAGGPGGPGHTRRRGRREQHPAGAVGGGVEQHPAVVQAMLKR